MQSWVRVVAKSLQGVILATLRIPVNPRDWRRSVRLGVMPKLLNREVMNSAKMYYEDLPKLAKKKPKIRIRLRGRK